MDVPCALSAFGSFAGLRGLWRRLQQQLRSNRIESDAIFHDRESYGCATGEQPGFYLHGSVYRQRRVYGKRGGGGELKLDGKRSLYPAFGFSHHAGNGCLHRYPRQPSHHQSSRCKRPDIDRTSLTDLPIKALPIIDLPIKALSINGLPVKESSSRA